MAIGDRYLATVEVTQIGPDEYRWQQSAVSIYDDEIKNLIPLGELDWNALDAARKDLERQIAGWEGNGSDRINTAAVIRAYVDALR